MEHAVGNDRVTLPRVSLLLLSAVVLSVTFLLLLLFLVTPVVRVPTFAVRVPTLAVRAPTFAVRVPVVRPPLPKLPVAAGPGGVRDTLALSVAVGNVSDAIETVREERTRTRAERDAFDEFLERVEETPTAQGRATLDSRTAAVGATAAATTGPANDHLERVREAYEGTVMDVPHYGEEYDDTVAESMVEELGRDVAGEVVSGRAFTPLLKRQLLGAARQSRRERESFLGTLEAERDALERARSTLEDVAERLDRETTRLPSQRSIDDLIATHGRLDDAREECEAVLEERQCQRTDGHLAVDAPRSSITDLCSYLYQSLPVTYPVLADATDLLGTISRTRRQITRELATRF